MIILADRFLYLQGSSLLTIFQKYLEMKGIEPAIWINEYVNALLKEFFPDFHDSLEEKKFEFEKFSPVSNIFASLKEKLLRSRVKDIDFNP